MIYLAIAESVCQVLHCICGQTCDDHTTTDQVALCIKLICKVIVPGSCGSGCAWLPNCKTVATLEAIGPVSALTHACVSS